MTCWAFDAMSLSPWWTIAITWPSRARTSSMFPSIRSYEASRGARRTAARGRMERGHERRHNRRRFPDRYREGLPHVLAGEGAGPPSEQKATQVARHDHRGERLRRRHADPETGVASTKAFST